MFKIFTLLVSLGLMVGVIFSNYPLLQFDSEATSIEYGLYDALSRIAWSIGLCYVIFECVHNKSGCINWFLSHNFWQPLSRLTYSIYLTHFFIVWITVVTTKTSLDFNAWDAVRFSESLLFNVKFK